MSERLITHYHDVLVCLDPRSPADSAEALQLARRTVEQAGGFEAELVDIEAVAAHHANNYLPLVARHRRRDRATMFAFVRVVELEAMNAGRRATRASAACTEGRGIRTTAPGAGRPGQSATRGRQALAFERVVEPAIRDFAPDNGVGPYLRKRRSRQRTVSGRRRPDSAVMPCLPFA